MFGGLLSKNSLHVFSVRTEDSSAGAQNALIELISGVTFGNGGRSKIWIPVTHKHCRSDRASKHTCGKSPVETGSPSTPVACLKDVSPSFTCDGVEKTGIERSARDAMMIEVFIANFSYWSVKGDGWCVVYMSDCWEVFLQLLGSGKLRERINFICWRFTRLQRYVSSWTVSCLCPFRYIKDNFLFLERSIRILQTCRMKI